jgi:2'-5' RNA ligase
MRKIKTYEELITEKNNPVYEYGCLMLKLKTKDWEKSVLSMIDKDDIYEGDKYGLENEPHITILYGVYDAIKPKDIQEYLKQYDFQYKYVELKNISLFQNELYDVVKFDIEDKFEQLLGLHDLVKNTFPNKQSYTNYHPHCTIAYVKKGRGVKYIQELKKPIIVDMDKLFYSYPKNNGNDKGEIDIVKF